MQIVIVGDLDSQDTQALLRCAHSLFLPSRVIVHVSVTSSPASDWLKQQVPFYASLQVRDDKATAYVCEDFTCSLPVTSVDELAAILNR